jgi:hypothetical protein
MQLGLGLSVASPRRRGGAPSVPPPDPLFAVRLSGSQNLTRTAAPLPAASPFVPAGWVYVPEAIASGTRTICTLYDGSGTIHTIALEAGLDSNHVNLRFTGAGYFLIYDQFTPSTHPLGNACEVGGWIHVALAILSNGNVEASFARHGAGRIVLTATHTAGSRTPTAIRFGSNNFDAASSRANVRLHNWPIWNEARTEAELQAQMELAYSGQFGPVTESGLYAHYRFDDHTVAGVDSSGNGRTLTVTGTLTTEDGPPVSASGGASSTDVVYVGHSLVGPDMAFAARNLGVSSSIPNSYQAQLLAGTSLKGNWEDAHLATTNAHDVLAQGNHEVFVFTEVVGPLDPVASETVTYARLWMDEAIAGNSAVRNYLYATWEPVSGTNWAAWRTGLDGTIAQWEQLADDTMVGRSGVLYVIPGGKALRRVYDDIAGSTAVGITHIQELFADEIHLSNFGLYLIACVTYACVFRQSPVGRPAVNVRVNNSSIVEIFDGPTRAYIQQVAWDVVTSDPRTGVTA